jgi:hypothetical protein
MLRVGARVEEPLFVVLDKILFLVSMIGWNPLLARVTEREVQSRSGYRFRFELLGEEDESLEGKRQRVGSVFDRIEEPSVDPARQGRREQ